MYTQSANLDNKMNYLNFERKYVKANAWDVSTVCLWKHENGTVCDINMYWEDNYVHVAFENGITLDVSLKGSVIKVGFHDDVRTRDLGTHPSWNGSNRKMLVKLWLRHVLSMKTTDEQREALWDIVSSEFTI
ncbi:Hypothetical protein KNT65_gp221 [Escherichia phage EcS1]|uniref:Uncharacterized protein n=1 Tax=Escherichia phage EcS1 TaxID=2083276 RepID=A0A2Z5ZCW8_9CAUD|nr:Hypothetical protein KNT65_gp221 [Escherichia phage EcS1]BBC78272.1 Hypothetical protein [Escherichia phage EcS1]